jgi:hypothetical protein
MCSSEEKGNVRIVLKLLAQWLVGSNFPSPVNPGNSSRRITAENDKKKKKSHKPCLHFIPVDVKTHEV